LIGERNRLGRPNSAAWAAFDEPSEADFLALIEKLAAELLPGGGGIGFFERASSLDSTGHEREAVSVALAALAPHLPRYQRSAAAYARLPVEPETGS